MAEFLSGGLKDPDPGKDVKDEATRAQRDAHPTDPALLFDHGYRFRKQFEENRLLDLAKRQGWDPPQDTTLTWKPNMQPFKTAKRVGLRPFMVISDQIIWLNFSPLSSTSPW